MVSNKFLVATNFIQKYFGFGDVQSQKLQNSSQNIIKLYNKCRIDILMLNFIMRSLILEPFYHTTSYLKRSFLNSITKKSELFI